MIARLNSVAFLGIDAAPVEVEVDVTSRGFAGATIVGLPDAAVKESMERVRRALSNCRGSSALPPEVGVREAPPRNTRAAFLRWRRWGVFGCRAVT